MHPDDHDNISVIEDLDPDDPRGPVSGIRFDLLLGIPLILAVVLFAGWQWWRQDYTASQYRAGLDAAGQNDLDSALHFYSEASGYNDADIRAHNLRIEINERNRLYESAVDYSSSEKWLQA